MIDERRNLLDDDFNNAQQLKTRHGCVTAWLGFMIVVNAITAMAYLVGGGFMADSIPGADISPWMLPVLGVLSIANVVFAVMIFQWKKMGFWGFIVTSIAALIVNLSMGLGIAQSLAGLIGIGILFAILQIRQDEVTAWEHLE